MLADARADRLHHLEVDFEQVVAAHSGLARHPCGHDADAGAGDVGVVLRSLERGVEALHGTGLGEVEGLALGDSLGDVEQDDVAKLPDGGEMGERAADLSGADQGDLRSGHVSVPSIGEV